MMHSEDLADDRANLIEVVISLCPPGWALLPVRVSMRSARFPQHLVANRSDERIEAEQTRTHHTDGNKRAFPQWVVYA